MKNAVTIIAGIVFVVLAAFGLACLITIPIYYIVNWLFTNSVRLYLFGAYQITFWQAFWLSFLCGCLFKGSTITNPK